MKTKTLYIFTSAVLVLAVVGSFIVGAYGYRTQDIADIEVLVRTTEIDDSGKSEYVYDYDKKGQQIREVFVNYGELTTVNTSSYYDNGLLYSEEYWHYRSTIRHHNFEIEACYGGYNPKYIYEYYDNGELYRETLYYSGQWHETSVYTFSDSGKCQHYICKEGDSVYSSCIYYDANGENYRIDRNGDQDQYTYDELNRPVLVETLNDNESSDYRYSAEKYEYFDDTDIKKSYIYIRGPEKGTIKYSYYHFYDIRGNEIENGDVIDGEFVPDYIAEYTYDSETENIAHKDVTYYKDGKIREICSHDYKYDSKNGEITESKTVNSSATEWDSYTELYEYDEKTGKIKKESTIREYSSGYFSHIIHKYEYDEASGVILAEYTHKFDKESGGFRLTKSVIYEYDDAGRLIKKTETDFEYDNYEDVFVTEYKYMNLRDYYRQRQFVSDEDLIIFRTNAVKLYNSIRWGIEDFFEELFEVFEK